MARIWIVLGLTLWPVGVIAAESVSADIVYRLSSSGLEFATLVAEAKELTGPRLVITVLPFHSRTSGWNDRDIIGVINREDYAFAIVRLTPQRPTVTLQIQLNTSAPLTDGVRVMQTAYADTLIVPRGGRRALEEVAAFAQLMGGAMVVTAANARASLEAGFVLIAEGTETSLLDTRVVPLEPTTSGYRLTFRLPTSVLEEALQNSLGVLIVAVLGLLLAYAAPGLLPEGNVATIVIGGTVLLVAVLVGLRWSFAGRSRQALLGAITDTAVAVLYLMGLGLVWFLKWRRSRNSGAAPNQPLQPTAPGGS